MSYKYLGSSSAAPGSGSAAGPGSYLALDANNNLILTASAGGGGGTTPGTPLNSVQYNSAGSFAGSSNLTYNGTTLTGSFTGSLAEFTILSGSTVTGSTALFTTLEASSLHLAPTSGSLAGAGSYLGLNASNQLIVTASAGGGGGGVITALNNQAESRLVSIGSTTTELDGEANLTFDGTNLILTGAFNQSLVALSFVGAGTASVNGAASNMFSATVTGSQHLANPTNLLPGASYTFILTQDGTGGRTLSFGTSYLWSGGITGSLSTGANDVDILSAITDGTSLYCSLTKDFS